MARGFRLPEDLVKIVVQNELSFRREMQKSKNDFQREIIMNRYELRCQRLAKKYEELKEIYGEGNIELKRISGLSPYSYHD
jgi:hypothetical protein